ncbi:hypothetical protein OF83DRAFT_1133260 [Amylostereum chailletii]|nr:hypothetical protein OF83DRAFT_1133260 [Amylostereum chailletii]
MTAPPERAASLISDTTSEAYRRFEADPGCLTDSELRWRHYADWLEKEAGYVLRRRYQRDFAPPWQGKKKEYDTFEDGQVNLLAGTVMDAVRKSDNTLVFFKRDIARRRSPEVSIGLYFSTEPAASDPRNHCIPIYEVLDLPEDGGKVMVMPFYRPWDNPRFETIGEAVAFFGQIFEGIQFMHEHHVAHRDCTYNNIMYDPHAIYPNGFHPTNINRKMNWKGRAKHYTRTQRPPKYYLIDFGSSRKYDPAAGPPRELPLRGGDKTAPEHQSEAYDVPCDPFPTDIYYLGNLIRTRFLQKRFGFEFMHALVADMVQSDPSKRPRIDEVVARFNDIRMSLSNRQLRARIVSRNEPGIVRIWRAVPYYFRTASYILTRKAAIPEPPLPPPKPLSGS